MNKIGWTSKRRGIKVSIDNPNDEMKLLCRDHFREAIDDMLQESLAKVSEGLKSLKPGEKRVMQFAPMVVTIERPKAERKKAKTNEA